MPSPRRTVLLLLAVLLVGGAVAAVLARRSTEACERSRVAATQVAAEPERYSGCRLTTSAAVTTVFDDRGFFLRPGGGEKRRILVVLPAGTRPPDGLGRNARVEVTGTLHGFLTAADLGLDDGTYAELDGRPYLLATRARVVVPSP